MNKALGALENENPILEGVVSHIDFNKTVGKIRVPDQKLRDLIRHFGKYRLRNEDFEFPDLLGAAYEYLIRHFADSAGKKGGEFYTPRDVARLMVRLLKPKEGMRILGKIPKDWEVCPFGNKVTLQRGFDITSKKLRQGDIPIVSSSGITGYHDKFMVQGPGVITGRKGSLGQVFYVEGAYWPHDTTLWVKNFYGNNPKFVFRFIQGMHLERLDSATACPTLNRNFVHPILVAFPPISEQKQIIEVLDVEDTRIRIEETYLEKLKLQKQGLMHDLLTGKVRVKL